MMVGEFSLPILSQSVDSMSQVQLTAVVSALLGSSQLSVVPAYTYRCPPVWWPCEVPFLNPGNEDLKKVSNKKVMRNIVRSCYAYYGKEDMLDALGSSRASSPLRPVNHTNVSNSQRHNGMASSISVSDISLHKSSDKDLSNVTKIFDNTGCLDMLASTVSRHSLLSGEMPYEPGKVSPSEKYSKNLYKTQGVANSEEDSFLEIFICFFCEKEFEAKSELQHHQANCGMQPPTLQAQRGLPQTHNRSHRPPSLWLHNPDVYVLPDRKLFIEKLGLCLKSKAEALENKNKQRKVDCDVIDIRERMPKTPTTPRTPKSLMSQLREDVGLSPHQSMVRPLLSPGDDERSSNISSDEDDSDIESDSGSDSSKSDTVSDSKRVTLRCRSLLVIDLCSPLGQRVSKHICGDSEQTSSPYNIDKVCSNRIKFCHSPAKKNVGDRLRSRGIPLPVTFKKSKRTAPNHWHMFKFTGRQRQEFYKRKETGLNLRARKLLKKVKRCSINVHKLTCDDVQRFTARIHPSITMLTEEEVEMWTRKHSPGFSDTDIDLSEEDGIFPQGPGFLGSRSELQRLLGLKTTENHNSRECSPVRPLNLSQVVSEDDNAEVNQQKVLVYRTLLSELTRTPHQSNSISSNLLSGNDLTPPSTPEDQMSLQDISFDSSINSHISQKKSLSSQVQKIKNGVLSTRPTGKKLKAIKSNEHSVTDCGPSGKGKHKSKIEKTNYEEIAQSKNKIMLKAKQASKMSDNNGKKKCNKKTGQKSSASQNDDKTTVKPKYTKKSSKANVVVQKSKYKKQEIKSVCSKKHVGLKTKKTTAFGKTSHLRPAHSVVKKSKVNTKQKKVKTSEQKIIASKKGKTTALPVKAKTLTKNNSKNEKCLEVGRNKSKSLGNKEKNEIVIDLTDDSPTTSRNKEIQKGKMKLSKSAALQMTKKSKDKSDSVSESLSAGGRKRQSQSPLTQRPSKYAKSHTSRQPSPIKPLLLFRCRLCGAEIACREKFKELVIEHFDSVHKVRSIRLVEQEGPDGQTVLSIVEDLVPPDKLQSRTELLKKQTKSKHSKGSSAADSLWDPVDRCLFGDNSNNLTARKSSGSDILRKNTSQTDAVSSTKLVTRNYRKSRRTKNS